MADKKARLPLLQLLPLLLFCVAGKAAMQHQPRRLDKCPSEFETVVEPIPAFVGATIMEVAPDMQLTSVEFVNKNVLRVDEGKRLVLNESLDPNQSGGFYVGPFTMTCSKNTGSEFVAFSLYLQVPEDVDGNQMASTTSTVVSFVSKPPINLPEDPATNPPVNPPINTPVDPLLFTSSTKQPAKPRLNPLIIKPPVNPLPAAKTQMSSTMIESRQPQDADVRVMPLAAVTALLAAACIALSIALVVVVLRQSRRGTAAANGSSRDSRNLGGGNKQGCHLSHDVNSHGSSAPESV